MILYQYTITYKQRNEYIPAKETLEDAIPEQELPFVDEEPCREKKRFPEYIADDVNPQLGIECAMDGKLSIAIIDGKQGKLDLVAACTAEKMETENIGRAVCDTLQRVMPEAEDLVICFCKEIGSKQLADYTRRASHKGFINGRSQMVYELQLDYFDNHQFQVKERCVGGEMTLEQAMKKADAIMADDSLREELKRIYSEDNAKQYYGNPVHYKLTVGSTETALELVDILVPALHANHRLLGTRLTQIYDIEEGCYGEDDIEHLMKTSQGNTVLIEMRGADGEHGNYASSYESVVEYMNGLIASYGLHTLCMFIDSTEHPGFSQSLIAKVRETIDVIEIREGSGTYEEAISYFKLMSDQTDFPVDEKAIREILPMKKNYTVSEVRDAYKKWYGNGLRQRVYKAYKTVDLVKADVKKATSEPYQELQKMVGLTDIKRVVDQIIANGKIQKMRSELGMDSYKTSMHMIFTGNPGSAKTSVARLLAQILRKEGILESGRLVEVGRADLIARYVGWTAKTVCEKFREAQGGILFIDEAYSLVDDENSFGDEAINTIVQEMENHRDDVLVIFAGYPEKMKGFLDKNEGLRSRIAFHLDFPDYNADEMLQILELMAEKKGYEMDDGVRKKCFAIFQTACGQDEFGNGRFARNLLEQAMMKQSERIARAYAGTEISRKELSMLVAEDFDTNIGQRFKEKKKAIGFIS